MTAAYGQASDWQSHITTGEQVCKKWHFADAVAPFTQALQEAEKFGPNDPRLVKSLSSLAGAYVSQGKYADAEPLYKRALSLSEKIFGLDSPEVANSLERIACTQILQDKFDEAEPLVKRVIAIDLKKKTPHGAAVDLNNLAVEYISSGMSAKAAQLLDEAIRLDPNYGLAYDNRRIARTKLGDAEGANEDRKQFEYLGY